VRRVSAFLSVAFVLAAASTTSLALSTTPAAAEAGTTYTAQTPPVVDTVSGGPWNTSQGNPSTSEYASSDLLPTFAFGGSETTIGGVSEPNVAVYPGEKEPTGVPYPSGVAGTPGPLSGYCSTEESENEKGSPVSQPPGTELPFSPYYFPDVVRNADGSLTGYFDYRPKDADEAITVAKSTNNGESWTTEGKALEQNPGYCPTADTNDDGQGHPFVTSVNGTNMLYTLERSAGDYPGVGLLVHSIGANSSADPLSGLPADETSGIDPNTFATAPSSLSTTATNIPVTTLGSSQGPDTIVPGPYVDYTQNAPTSGSAPTVITCTGTTTSPSDELTGCTVPSGSFTVHASDDLVQVMEEANPGTGKTYTVPAGPNTPSGESSLSLAKLKWTVNAYGYADTTSNSNALAWLMNNNAPNRVYIDGHVVYCFTTNTNPITTNLQFCTSPTGPFTVNQNDAITGDPITPPTAQMTTGLVSPDGIVGTVPYMPTFNGQSVPGNATIMLYTEKIVNYFVEGELNGSLNASGTTYTPGSGEQPSFTLPGGATAYGLNYQPFPGTSEPLPANGTPFTIYTSTTGTTSPIIAITCSNWSTTVPSNAPSGSVDVYNCTGGTAGGKIDQTGSTNTKIGEGTGYWIGGPNAAVVPYSVLHLIGEGKDGKTSGPGRLFGNNEDYTVLRAAYTQNGVNFTDLGPVSGTSSGTGSTNGSYTDLANPLQQSSPENSANPTVATTSPTAPTNLSPGSADTVELRYIGSRGTIIVNPNGSLGMFLSGSWPTDGDSDAFNQIFYTSSTDGGQTWSVPTVVLSTEYEFNASREQDEALAKGKDEQLGVSAYYSGRAYGPAVVQNPNGSLTMVFSGYRLPKPVTSAGTELGTGPSKYKIGAKDPAIYRNILTMHLASATSPRVATSTAVSASDEGTGLVQAPVTYTATVAPQAPGTGTPTGTVSFSDSHGPIAGCSSVQLSESSPDTATCATTHEAPAGSDEVSATYSGDPNYAGSSGTTTENVTEAPAITSANEATFTEGTDGSFEVTDTGTPKPMLTESEVLPEGVSFDDATGKLSGTPTQEGVFHIDFTAANGVGSNAVQPFTLTVDAPPTITSASEATFAEGTEVSFPVTATGTPTPTISESGELPEGLKFNDATGTLEGTPTQTGVFAIEITAANGVGSNAVQSFTLTVNEEPAITSADETTFTEGDYGSFPVTASGFPSPRLSESGEKPPHGVTFEPFSGTLSGTPTQEGVYHLTFEATNGVGSNAVQPFTLTVDAPPSITSASSATFTYGVPGSFTVKASGTPSPSIEEWGNLPEGVSYSDGVLSGTPTQIGTFKLTLTAENGIGADSVQRFTLTVLGLHVTTSSLPEASPGAAYSQQLQATGGVPPYRWKVTAGSLPKGLKLSTTGLLTGTVSMRAYPHGGSFPITVTVTDHTKRVHQTAKAALTLLVS
jgi:hypothetical protein